MYLFALKIPHGKPSFFSFLIRYYSAIVKFTTKPTITYSTYGKKNFIIEIVKKN